MNDGRHTNVYELLIRTVDDSDNMRMRRNETKRGKDLAAGLEIDEQ